MIDFTFHNFIKASSQKGGALIYILIAVALLAALTTTFIQPGGQSSRTQNSFKLATLLNSQARVVRSAIQDCVLRFPEGNSAIAETGYFDPYPLNPDSTDATYTAYDVTNKNVSELRCPGSSFDQIFSGTGQFSSYLPSPPDLMDQWTYFNGGKGTGNEVAINGLDVDGVFFQTTATKSDPFIGEAMGKVDGLMSACEVDHIVGDGSNGCANNTQCLRFWILRDAGTAATPGCP